MRQIVALIGLVIAAAGATGCAATNAASPPDTVDAATAGPTSAIPATGRLLPARHRVGGLPVDIYNADALRRQGITSAAGAVQQVPQNSGR